MSVAEMPRLATLGAGPEWPPLEQRAIRVKARARMLSALRSIAFDLLGPSEPDDLPAEMGAWVEDAAERAAYAVCDKSMRALIQSLESTVAAAPEDLHHRLHQASVRHDMGFD